MIGPLLGRVVATPGALKLLKEAGEDPRLLLARHRSGDWGELDLHDRRENEFSLKHGWRLVSSYAVGGSYVWTIMETGPSGYEPDELPDCFTPRRVESGLEKARGGCSGADRSGGTVQARSDARGLL